MKRLLGLRPLVILALAASIAVVMVKSRPQLEARAVETPPPMVQVQRISPGVRAVSISAHGNVTARHQINLAAQVNGQVIWKAPVFETGAFVPAGTTLLKIDPTDYELALAEAKQTLASAELSLADAKSLRQSARIEEASKAVAAARARIKRAQRDLDNTRITAPIDAVLDSQLVEESEYLRVGTPVATLLGTAVAEIRLPIPPKDIQFLSDAASESVILTDESRQTPYSWHARISRIEARVDEQTRVYPVVVEVEDPLGINSGAEPLRFGMFVRADITGAQMDNAVVLPTTALHGGSDVFLYQDGKLARRTVTVSRVDATGVLISDGLEPGDQVVTTRLDLMFAGMAVATNNE